MDQSYEYRSIRGRARFAKVGIFISMGFSIVLAVALLGQAFVLGVPVDLATPGELATTAVALSMCCGGLGVLGSLVLAGATFLTWMHRATANAHARGRDLTFSPGESVGMWFVPFANLVRPYQMVAELDRALDNDSRPEAASKTASDISLWWALWIGCGVLSWGGQIDALGLEVTASITAFTTVLRLGCALLIFRIIDRISDRLEGDTSPVEF